MVMMIKMVMTAMMATILTICDIDDGGDHDCEKVGIGVRMVRKWRQTESSWLPDFASILDILYFG